MLGFCSLLPLVQLLLLPLLVRGRGRQCLARLVLLLTFHVLAFADRVDVGRSRFVVLEYMPRRFGRFSLTNPVLVGIPPWLSSEDLDKPPMLTPSTEYIVNRWPKVVDHVIHGFLNHKEQWLETRDAIRHWRSKCIIYN